VAWPCFFHTLGSERRLHPSFISPHATMGKGGDASATAPKPRELPALAKGAALPKGLKPGRQYTQIRGQVRASLGGGAWGTMCQLSLISCGFCFGADESWPAGDSSALFPAYCPTARPYTSTP